jgi:pyruvate/2-oxoglutarate dehydrogenase complex dihydrolipoamide acyltransferase (E2) component
MPEPADPSPPPTSPGFEISPFAAERRAITAALEVGARRHTVHALLEIDVTQARQRLRALAEETGERLSFTAFVVACVARAIDRNRLLHAYRDWRGRLVLFDDVDVVALVESEANRVAVPHVLRAANRRTVRELHDEIHRVRSSPASSRQASGRLMKLSRLAPASVIGLFLRVVRRRPQWLKRTSGTTLVTSLGMFGSGFGWGIGIVPLHTLAVTVGAVALRPGVVDGRVEIREHLALTLSIDHDIVDGAPAARFAAELRALLEGADGLGS